MGNIIRIGSTPAVGIDKINSNDRKQTAKQNSESTVPAKNRDIIEIGAKTETVVYSRTKIKNETVSAVQRMADKTTENMQRIVRKAIKNQGSFSLASVLMADDIESAKESIAVDGDFGIEAVSSRIVDFAVSLAGSDPEQLTKMKAAIEEGFRLAREAFGGKLPGICEQTHDEIMKQMDALISGKDNA
jgi:hypothetical protein